MNSKTVKICLFIFVLAAGVRLLVWQNNQVAMSDVQWILTHIYKEDAGKLINGDVALFLAGPDPPSDANVLLHPPGYSLMIALVQAIAGKGESFRVFQILLNSLSPVLIFLIAARLFDTRVGFIAGVLAGFSPQLAYHSGLFLPDELSVLPLLIAIYVLIRAKDDPRILLGIFCGVSIGVSCWLRSNALLLPIFFAVAAIAWLPGTWRIRFALTLVAAFVLTIAPITLRNYVVFGSFIPLSLGAGTTFIEGLGDYDPEGRFGLPVTDEGVMEMDVRRSGRPDYYGFLYNPDGVERERARLKDGLKIVAENPAWYAGSVIQRGVGTLRFERVPTIAPERDERESTPLVLYYLNRPLKLFQSLFITAVLIPLAFFGLIMTFIDRERRGTLIVLAILPVYYGTVQALIHTEYRYVLATPHILLILAAVAVSFVMGKVAARLRELKG